MNKWFVFLVTVSLIALLGLVDIGLNLFSLIPYVGSAFETVSEAVLEFLQILIAAAGGFLLTQMEVS